MLLVRLTLASNTIASAGECTNLIRTQLKHDAMLYRHQKIPVIRCIPVYCGHSIAGASSNWIRHGPPKSEIGVQVPACLPIYMAGRALVKPQRSRTHRLLTNKQRRLIPLPIATLAMHISSTHSCDKPLNHVPRADVASLPSYRPAGFQPPDPERSSTTGPALR